MERYPLVAPLHCQNFDTLAQQGFYDSLAFHRVVPNFVIQGGDPNSRSGPPSTWGMGAPWQQTVPAEFNAIPHQREIIGAARAVDINSATSQFYINLVNNSHLNGNYTAYGRVISGMDVVDSVEDVPTNSNGLPNSKVDMFMTYVGEDTSAPAMPPSLLTPADGSTNLFGSVNFSWSAVSPLDFILYKIQFSRDSNFSSIEYERDVWHTTTSIDPMTELDQGYITYYWRVMTNNGGRLSAPSQVWSFQTSIAPPNLIYPGDDDTTQYINPVMAFSSIPQATEYHLMISKVPTLLIPAQIEVDTIISDTLFQTPFLFPNRIYYWSVASIDNGLQGAFAPLNRFRSGFSINSLEGVIDSEPSIYPNPVDDILSIYVGGSFEASLYDELGKDVLSKTGQFDSTEVDVSSLTPGFYILRLVKGEKVTLHRILIE